MTREISLINYLPPFMRDYEEIVGLTDAENPEFFSLFEQAQKVRDNAFILYANDDGLKRYEKLLKLFPASDESIESRRVKVLARMGEQLPFTVRVLKRQLDRLCGSDGYSLYVENRDYQIRILLFNPDKNIHLNVLSMLNRMIPANMLIDMSVHYEIPDTCIDIVTLGMGVYKKDILDWDLFFKTSAESDASIASDISLYKKVTVNCEI